MSNLDLNSSPVIQLPYCDALNMHQKFLAKVWYLHQNRGGCARFESQKNPQTPEHIQIETFHAKL